MTSTSLNPNYKLSLIIPFRADPSLPYLLDRLEDQLVSMPRHPQVEILVVDSGSSNKDREICQKLCESSSVTYLYHDSEGKTFSIGEARDYGVCNALGDAITFLDVDLRISFDFWSRLLPLMEVMGISNKKKAFFAIPCLYLSQSGTSEFLTSNERTRFIDFHQRWLHGDTISIDSMAPCSSVMIVDRLHYMSIGGHRPEFRGHGYEDFELYHRLIGEENILPRASDYYKDTKNWEASTYSGFRSQFSILGQAALQSNLFVIHLWHPRPKSNNFYGSVAHKNRTIWMDFFKQFDENKEHPEPLINSAVRQEKIIFFGKPFTNASRALRDIFPLLGDRLYISEFELVDDDNNFQEDKFLELVKLHKITKILFPNPYGNEVRKSIYQWAQKNNFPYYCWERGALPDSWFLDPKGFNSDSSSYNRIHWDFPLSEDQTQQTKHYISRTLRGELSLEKQGERIGGDALLQRLKIGGRKVLFVPMQRPSDTVIKYMSDDIGEYQNFITFIDDVAKKIKPFGWIVLCKRHPLETESPQLIHANYVDENTHFIDLLEVADAVALVNSGVGVYAAMLGKPCYHFGNAFYSFEGINKKMSIHEIDDFVKQVLVGYKVNQETVLRFINYLTQKFYSFGASKTKIRAETDGSLRSITTGIDFYEIRVPGLDPKIYTPLVRNSLSSTAPIFSKFHLDIIQKKKSIKDKENFSVGKHTSIASKIHSPTVPEKNNRSQALWLKFRHKPHRFFKDSKIAAIRPLRFLFKPQ